MSHLVVAMLAVEPAPAMPAAIGSFPVVSFAPGQGPSWCHFLNQVAETGACLVLLAFSNEHLDIPSHGWDYLDVAGHTYHRLYTLDEFLAAESPLSLIGLFPVRPLPGLLINPKDDPLAPGESSLLLSKAVAYFDTRQWEKLERLIADIPSKQARQFALSCLYAKTFRFEEAYTVSRQALTATTPAADGKAEAMGIDSAGLWLAHGIHAARTGRYDEAAAAFRMSDTERRHEAPLAAWSDMLLEQNLPREEVLAPIAKWLDKDPEREERLLELYRRLGWSDLALELIELPPVNSRAELVPIRFDCLLRAGRLSEAVMLFQSQDEEYKQKHPIDSKLAELLLGTTSFAAAEPSCPDHLLLALLDKAVALRLFAQAENLQAAIAGTDPLALAFSLFRHGYVMRSAGLFLAALQNQTLPPEGFRCLGTILYYRGAYEQASGMFEYALAHSPDDAALRTALALSCLRQSEALLNESMYIFPSSVFLREEAEKVAAGIKRMEQSDAIPRWQWAERMNFHG